MDTARDKRSAGVLLRWTERLLLATGAVLLLGVALSLLDTYFAQERAREALMLAVRPDASDRSIDPHRAVRLARGVPVGELSIPRVHLSAVVLHGSDARTLRKGPGHIEGTPLPGSAGNVAVAGHRDSFFRPLRNVGPGDDIFFDTELGRFHYRVEWTTVVEPHRVDVLDVTETATLTLVTCYPFWVAGAAPERFVVRAVQVAPAAIADRRAPASGPQTSNVARTSH